MERFLYKIKDNYSDTRAKYKECLTFIVWEDIPQKYINTKIPYRHSYYFTAKEDMDNFLDELIKTHKAKEQITQEYLSKHKQKEQQKLFYYRLVDEESSEYDQFIATDKECTDFVDILVDWWGNNICFDEEDFNKEYCINIITKYINDNTKAMEIVEQYITDCKEKDGDFGAITEFISEHLNKVGITCHEIEFTDTFSY